MKGEIRMISSLKRINELAQKNRTEGLTEAEIAERAELIKEYLQEIRGQVSSNITSITIQNEEGIDVTPAKLNVEKVKKYLDGFQ